MTDHFFTIEATSETELMEKGSRFIAYAFPLNNVAGFKEMLKRIKELHPKASHHCFAYRIGTSLDIYRSSDDGEPSGTAGKPILGQIDSRSLTNCGIIVVRYFGGTMLGIPGLIKAYKSISAIVLQLTPSVKKHITKKLLIQFPHDQLNTVMTLVKRFNGEIETLEHGLFCTASCLIDIGNFPLISQILENEKSIEIL